MMKKTIVLLLLWGAVSLHAIGQQAQQLSLKQAMEYAVQHNKEVENARLDVQKARKQVMETTAIGLPQVNASVGYQNMLDIPTQLMPDFITPAVVGVNEGLFGLTPTADIPESQFFPVKFGTQHNASFELQASQLIFSGPYIVGLQAARIYKNLSIQGLERTEIQIKEQVAQTYFLVLMAQENKKLMEANIAELEKLYKDTKAMSEQGFIDATEADQIKLNLENLKTMQYSLDKQIESTFFLLKFQLGMTKEDKIELSEDLESLMKSYLDMESNQMTPEKMASNIDLRLMDTQVQLAQLQYRREKTEYYPSLSAFFSHKQNAMRDDFDFFEKGKDWFPSNILGVSLNIPVFSSGQRLAKVQQAKIELEKARNTRNNAEQGLNLQYMQASAEFQSTFFTYINEEQAKKIADKIYKNNKAKFENGMGSSLELTQSYTQYLSSQMNYYSAIVKLLNAQVAIYKLTNRL